MLVPACSRVFPGYYLFFVLFAFCNPVFAQNTQEVPELVVTAGLMPLPVGDVASSVTIINRQEIEQRQVKYLADLLRNVPGFSVSQAGGAGAQTQIRVRGAEANHLLVLIDNIRANDPAQGDEFQYQYALTSDIERIEIIRGPQSATWGTDAMAGVVNIIRRKDVATQYLAANAEFGSFNSAKFGIDGSVVRESFRASGGLSLIETDGINVSREGDEKDGADNTTANAALEWGVGDHFRFLVSGMYVDASSDFDAIDFINTGLPTDADRVTKNQQGYARAELAYEPTAGRWNGAASVNWTDSKIENFADGNFDTATASDTLEARLRTSVKLGAADRDDHVLSFALDRRDVSFSQRGTASPFGDPNQDQSYDVTGLAAEYMGKPTEQLTWSVSGRQDNYSDFDDATTWRAAASYYFTGTTRLRGSFGTGSKVPTFTERFGFFSDFFVGNPNLKPESSKSWEIGIDTAWQEGRYTLGVAYFDQDLEDEIDGFVFDPVSGAFTAANKQSASDRQGVELVLGARILDSLTLNASYTYVDATETDGPGMSTREVSTS